MESVLNVIQLHDAFIGHALQRHDLIGYSELGRLVLSRFVYCKQTFTRTRPAELYSTDSSE